MSDLAVINLDESCDISQSSEFLETIRKSATSGLQINAEKVERIDTSILQVLINAYLSAGKQGKTIEIVNASDKFKQSARLVGADTILFGK